MGKDLLTKLLAVAGALLAWSPIVAPVLLGLSRLALGHGFRFDYLMPAELFPVGLAGGGLLLWAALRARSRRGLIAWGLGAAVALLVGGQALAVVTGLASGEAEPAGWPLALVFGSIALYTLALVAVALGGALLVRDLFGRGRPPGTSRG